MRAVLSILLITSTIFAEIKYGSFEFGGQEREYIVFLPSNYEPDLPLVFNLHGYGGTAQWQMDNSFMNEVADTANFVVVYPNAISTAWNSGISDNPDYPTPDVDDVGFISALIDTIHTNYQINLDRVYTCGGSNGGFMSFRLACELNDRFAKVASVIGTLTNTIIDACDSVQPIPTLLMNGTDDQIVLYDGSEYWKSANETHAYWLDVNGCSQVADTISLPDIDPLDGCTVDVITNSDCNNNSEVVLYILNNAGHTWPGWGEEYETGALAFLGTTIRDVVADVEIWNFFNSDNIQNPLLIDNVDHELLVEFELNQNYPNPFNPTTSISYDIPERAEVSLRVYDVAGSEVKILNLKEQSAGHYKVQWNGVDASGNPVSTGVYFARIQAGEFSKTIKMVYLK